MSFSHLKGGFPRHRAALPPQGRVPETSGYSALQGGLGRETPRCVCVTRCTYNGRYARGAQACSQLKT
eukprot:215977-Prymnesium_polylepis.1